MAGTEEKHGNMRLLKQEPQKRVFSGVEFNASYHNVFIEQAKLEGKTVEKTAGYAVVGQAELPEGKAHIVTSFLLYPEETKAQVIKHFVEKARKEGAKYFIIAGYSTSAEKGIEDTGGDALKAMLEGFKTGKVEILNRGGKDRHIKVTL